MILFTPWWKPETRQDGNYLAPASNQTMFLLLPSG